MSSIKELFEYVYCDYEASGIGLGRALFNSCFRAVVSYRLYYFIYNNISKMMGYYLYQRSMLKYGVEIAPTAKIGKGLVLSHLGGTVIGRLSIIGSYACINSGVTIGMKDNTPEMPRCGDRVTIGTGAKLLGGITIGNDVTIGANAVVISHIASDSVAVGIPAKVIKKGKLNSFPARGTTVSGDV